MRVVIVGAGLAGLRAARLLTAAGADVALLDGGHRPGGRVRTVRHGLKGGQYSESGAEWVDDVNVRMLELLDRYGIGRLGSASSGPPSAAGCIATDGCSAPTSCATRTLT